MKEYLERRYQTYLRQKLTLDARNIRTPTSETKSELDRLEAKMEEVKDLLAIVEASLEWPVLL